MKTPIRRPTRKTRKLTAKPIYSHLGSRIFFTISVFFLVLVGWRLWARFDPNHLSFAPKDPLLEAQKTTLSEMPITLIIPAFDMTLPVLPSYIARGKWTTTEKGVSYLTSSGIPGEKGNVVLYGHNWPSILGKLQRIKPGMNVFLVRNDGIIFSYTIQYTLTVTPDQTHILAQTPDSRLTIYTCSGWFDAKRFVVVATQDENSSL